MAVPSGTKASFIECRIALDGDLSESGRLNAERPGGERKGEGCRQILPFAYFFTPSAAIDPEERRKSPTGVPPFSPKSTSSDRPK